MSNTNSVLCRLKDWESKIKKSQEEAEKSKYIRDKGILRTCKSARKRPENFTPPVFEKRKPEKKKQETSMKSIQTSTQQQKPISPTVEKPQQETKVEKPVQIKTHDPIPDPTPESTHDQIPETTHDPIPETTHDSIPDTPLDSLPTPEKTDSMVDSKSTNRHTVPESHPISKGTGWSLYSKIDSPLVQLYSRSNSQIEDLDPYVEQDISHLSPIEQRIHILSEKTCREWRDMIAQVLNRKRTTLKVEFDWESFRQGILEQYDEKAYLKVLDGMFDPNSVVLSIKNFIQFCETNPLYKRFFAENLKVFKLKFSASHSVYGFYKDGEICEIVDVFIRRSGLKWMKRDFTKNFIACRDLHVFIINSHLIPGFNECISGAMENKFSLNVDWESIEQHAKDKKLAIKTLSEQDKVFERISRAFDDISSYSSEEMYQATRQNITSIVISYGESLKHKYDEQKKEIIMYLTLDSPEKLYEIHDYYFILKFYAVYKGHSYFKYSRLVNAACLPDVILGDFTLLSEIANRNELVTYTAAELEAFKVCTQYVEEKYKEKTIKAWHVIKYNKKNLAQERILLLTEHAYYTLRYDFAHKRIDRKKRHEVDDICVIDIGSHVCKIYTYDPKTRSQMFKSRSLTWGHFRSNSDCVPTAIKELRPASRSQEKMSPPVTPQQLDYLSAHPKKRVKREKPRRIRPDVSNNYASVFTSFNPNGASDVITDIAWTVYAVSNFKKRGRGRRPFLGQKLAKPRGAIYSNFYNKLGLGVINKDIIDDWIEYQNPLYKEEDDDYFYHELKKQSRELYIPPDWVETMNPLHSHYKIDEKRTVDEYNKRKEKYNVEKRLAAGNEGSIYLAVNKLTGQKVALKALNYTLEQNKEKIDKELALTLRLNHQHIVKHHEFFVIQSESFGGIEEHVYIVMEYCQTSVENVIKSRNEPLSDSIILSWLRQVLYALHYLHQNDIIHRDIKTDNLLLYQLAPSGKPLAEMEKWTIKLCDFGFATDMKQLIKNRQPGGSECGILVGTPLYMAPEIQMFKDYDTKADLWSLGVVILQLLMNKPATEMPQLFQEVSRNQDYVKQLCEQKNYNKTLSTIATECLKLNPQERPTALDLINQHFLIDIITQSGYKLNASMIGNMIKQHRSGTVAIPKRASYTKRISSTSFKGSLKGVWKK